MTDDPARQGERNQRPIKAFSGTGISPFGPLSLGLAILFTLLFLSPATAQFRVDQYRTYGPYVVRPGDWIPTDVILTEGQKFQVLATGRFHYKVNPNFRFGPAGDSQGGYHLAGAIGDSVVGLLFLERDEVESNRPDASLMTSWLGGRLRLGAPARVRGREITWGAEALEADSEFKVTILVETVVRPAECVPPKPLYPKSYGPFTVTPAGWQSTGIVLRRDWSFRIEAWGRFTSAQAIEHLHWTFPPDAQRPVLQNEFYPSYSPVARGEGWQHRLLWRTGAEPQPVTFYGPSDWESAEGMLELGAPEDRFALNFTPGKFQPNSQYHVRVLVYEGPVPADHYATVLLVEGSALYRTPDHDWEDVSVGLKLERSAEISTGPESSLVLNMCPSGAMVRFGELAEADIGRMVTEEGRAQEEVFLRRGGVKVSRERGFEEYRRAMDRILNRCNWHSTDPNDPNSCWYVETPVAIAGVRGTVFEVRHDEASLVTSVTVEDGVVDVTPVNPGLEPFVISVQQRLEVTPDRSGPPLNDATLAACGFTLGSAIHSKWMATGGGSGYLGCPVMDEADAAGSPQGTAGRYAEFGGSDGGYVIEHRSGSRAGQTFDVNGCIFKHYRHEGGMGSWLGFPLGDAYEIPLGSRQDFEGGYIAWDSHTRMCDSYRSGEPVPAGIGGVAEGPVPGAVWTVTVPDGWTGTWTRRGGDEFDLTWARGDQRITGTMTLVLRGDLLVGREAIKSDGYACEFTGGLEAGGTQARGTFVCPAYDANRVLDWSAVIDALPAPVGNEMLPTPPRQREVWVSYGATWVGVDADFVSKGESATPDREADGHFTFTYGTDIGPYEIRSITAMSSDSAGNPVGGQVWTTRADATPGTWVLGVSLTGRTLNTERVSTLGRFIGPGRFDLYAANSGWFNPGQSFVIEVDMGGGEPLRSVVQIPNDFAVAAPAPAPAAFEFRGRVATDAYQYQEGQPITVTFTDFPGAHDWIAIAPAGSVEQGNYLEWQWTNGATTSDRPQGSLPREGTLVFRGLAAGSYEVRAMSEPDGISHEARVTWSFSVAPPDAVPAGGGIDLTGTWRWFTGWTVVIEPSGAIRSSVGHTGTLQVVDPASRHVRMTWSHGYTDDLVLSSDGRRLDGRNQEGTTVWGERETNAAGGGDEGIFVDARQPTPVITPFALEAGRWYILEASGTYSVWDNNPDKIDSVWCYWPSRCPTPEHWQQLRVDGQGLSDLSAAAGGPSPLPYEPSHVYRVYVQGQGRPLELVVLDAYSGPGGINSGYDNSGGLTVRITPAP